MSLEWKDDWKEITKKCTRGGAACTVHVCRHLACVLPWPQSAVCIFRLVRSLYSLYKGNRLLLLFIYFRKTQPNRDPVFSKDPVIPAPRPRNYPLNLARWYNLSWWIPQPIALRVETDACQMSGEMNILLEAVVKGYHQCPFTIRTGESFARDE